MLTERTSEVMIHREWSGSDAFINEPRRQSRIGGSLLKDRRAPLVFVLFVGNRFRICQQEEKHLQQKKLSLCRWC